MKIANKKWLKVWSGIVDVVSIVILALYFLVCLIGGVLVGIVCGVFRYNPSRYDPYVVSLNDDEE